MRPHWKVSLLLGLALAASMAPARVTREDLIRYMEGEQIPGMTVTVMKNGRIVEQYGLGYADLENKVRMHPEAVLEIGSVTKMYFAAVILRLVEQGKLNLDAPIGQYLPDLPESHRALTLRRLLNHTSGSFEYLGGLADLRRDYSDRELMEVFLKRPLDFGPGEAWSYSNGGYLLAGQVAAKVTGKSWRELMQTEVIDRLGLKETWIQQVNRIIPRRTQGYAMTARGQTNAEPIRPSSGNTAGAILASGTDVARWAQAWFDGRIARPDVQREAFVPAQLARCRTFDYGLGWFLDNLGPYKVAEHGGNTFGYSANLYTVPSEKLTVVVLTNGAGKNLTGLSARIAAGYLRGIPAPPPNTVKPDPNPARTKAIRDAFIDLIQNGVKSTQIDPEMQAFGRAQRGFQVLNAYRTQIGRPLRMQFLSERAMEAGDTTVNYLVDTERDRLVMSFRISAEGKLVRIGVEPVGPRPRLRKQTDPD